MANYWGFDTFACPSSGTLSAAANEGFKYIGYYLAPTANGVRLNTSFMGKKSTILSCGLNPLVIYLAQDLSKTSPVASEGTSEANDAINLAMSEGFSSGTYIYLDIESPCAAGTTREQNYHAYVRNWVSQVITRGYKAGIYVSASYAQYFKQTLSNYNVRYWVYTTDVRTINPSAAAPAPSGSGFADAFMWQFSQNTSYTFSNGTTLVIDANSSKNDASPSS